MCSLLKHDRLTEQNGKKNNVFTRCAYGTEIFTENIRFLTKIAAEKNTFSLLQLSDKETDGQNELKSILLIIYTIYIFFKSFFYLQRNGTLNKTNKKKSSHFKKYSLKLKIYLEFFSNSQLKFLS